MKASRAVNIEDLRQAAKRALPRMVFDYIDGGADDEITLRKNTERLRAHELIWDCLVDVTKIDTRTKVMGSEMKLPFVLSPTALQRMFHVDGEKAAAAAAGKAEADPLIQTSEFSAAVPIAQPGLIRVILQTTPDGSPQVFSFQLFIELDRLTVRAPRAGTILRRDIEPGEQSRTDPARPMLILGDLSTLHVRAQVDEEDMPLLRAGAMAKARVRGPLSRERGELDLKMLWIEPLAGPKRQITNASTELVDTRVVEVIFELRPEDQKGVTLYPGQVVDVYIDAPEAHTSEESKPDSPKVEAAQGPRSSK